MTTGRSQSEVADSKEEQNARDGQKSTDESFTDLQVNLSRLIENVFDPRQTLAKNPGDDVINVTLKGFDVLRLVKPISPHSSRDKQPIILLLMKMQDRPLVVDRHGQADGLHQAMPHGPGLFKRVGHGPGTGGASAGALVDRRPERAAVGLHLKPSQELRSMDQ